jgi:hypothetical protein
MSYFPFFVFFQTDPKALHDYIELFIETYRDLIDYDLNHLTDG